MEQLKMSEFNNIIVSVSSSGQASLVCSPVGDLESFMDGPFFEDNCEVETISLFPKVPGVYLMTIEYKFEQGCSPEGYPSDGESTWDFIPKNIRMAEFACLHPLEKLKDEAIEALNKIASDPNAESVELVISHIDGSVSTIRGDTPAMYSKTDLGGSTELHPTDETLGIHTQWVEVSVTFRLDKATIEYKPSPALDKIYKEDNH